jgi:hypothetical protein
MTGLRIRLTCCGVCRDHGVFACRPRLIYRVHRGRGGGKASARASPRRTTRLLDAAHQQLAGPLVVIWDNLDTHVSAAMTELN